MSRIAHLPRPHFDAARRGRGRISLIGAGPGAADLLTLRAVRCLGLADVVFYDRLVEPEVLTHVRSGATRICVGKEVGAHAWPQPRIDRAIVAAALEGRRVVRLKSGDPSIFGRAAEEIAAARAQGIEVEVIPGITAASAAAAELCRPLTERGRIDRVVLATATCRTDDAPPDLGGLVRPGAMLVFYMAMHRLGALSEALAAAGLGSDHPATICAEVSRPQARSLTTTVGRMAGDCAAAGITNPAVVMVAVAKAPGDGTPGLLGQGRGRTSTAAGSQHDPLPSGV